MRSNVLPEDGNDKNNWCRGVLVLAGKKLIFFLVVGPVFCFGFRRGVMVRTH